MNWVTERCMKFYVLVQFVFWFALYYTCLRILNVSREEVSFNKTVSLHVHVNWYS